VIKQRLAAWGPDFRAALPGWIGCRIVVLSALFAALLLQARHGAPKTRYWRLHIKPGLLSWDGDWYLRIAKHGYANLPPQARRFFPLYPMLGRAVASLPGVPLGLALVALANVAALVAGALLYRLALVETGDKKLARRATWLMAFTPASFVLVMGYSEAMAIGLSVGMFLALRSRRWGWAFAAGVLAGAVRPTGVLLVVPAVWVAVRGWGEFTAKQRAGALVSATGPLVGCGAYLVWAGAKFGKAFQPLKVQQSPLYRGKFVDLFSAMGRAVADLVHGDFRLNAARVPFVFIVLALVVVCARRWPGMYTAYAVASLVVVLSSQRWGSLERYSLATFPFILALASCNARRSLRVTMATVMASSLAIYALLAFLAFVVP